MSILFGYGKTKTNKDGGTYISAFFTKEFLKLCPQLEGMLINARHIPAEQRKTENSPHWAFELFCPQEVKQDNNEPAIPEEIPFD